MTSYTPSPSTSRQSDVPEGHTIQKLKDKMQQIFHRRTHRRDPVTSVIETDFLSAEVNGNKDSACRTLTVASEHSHTQSSIGSSSYERVSNSSSYGTFEDDEILEESKCTEVANHLNRNIRTTSQPPLRCDLYLPSDLVNKISRDVVRMSQCEPCGLRGCVLFLNLEKRQSSHSVSQIVFDSETLSTFELTLTLIEDKKQWFSWKALFKPAVSRCLSDSWNEQVFISPGYRLVKKKLYREH